jgi:hypothetical protein
VGLKLTIRLWFASEYELEPPKRIDDDDDDDNGDGSDFECGLPRRGPVTLDVLQRLIIIYSFKSRSRVFHLYGDVTIAGEGLQN